MNVNIYFIYLLLLYFVQLYLLCDWIVVLCLNNFVLVLNEDTRIIKTVLMDILVGLYCAFTKHCNFTVSFPELFTMSSHEN